MLDKQTIVWTDTSGIPLTDDNEVPIEPEAGADALMHVSAKFFIRYLEWMAEDPEKLNLVDTGFMDMDPELKQEVIQSFLGLADEDVRSTEKSLRKGE